MSYSTAIASFSSNRGQFKFSSETFFDGLIRAGSVPVLRARAMRRAVSEIGGDSHVASLQVDRTNAAYYVYLVKDYGSGFMLRVPRKGPVGTPRFDEMH